MKYKPIIGLEIHVELNTKSKMFCSCRNNPNARISNFEICPICLGHPGTLPVINKEAVKKVLKTGLALNCEIPKQSKFDRKNYFYPDLPKGYQISQYDKPLCGKGYLEINKSPKGEQDSYGVKKIRITRIHLEEDTGRLIHPEGANYSLVDFNRAGIPLMELVTEPDLESGKEARKFAQELQLILRYLNVSEANMEKGELRVEVNISLSPKSKGKTQKLGTKVEIKNLNSFRAIEKAIEYEIKRQTKVLKSGKKVIQETRGWHDNKQKTFSQREKEESHDYRYFPEPDLPVVKVQSSRFKVQGSKNNIINLEEIKEEIPELPQQKRKRFKEEYWLSDKEIEVFVANKDLGEYFEKVMSEFREWVKEGKMKPKVSEEEFKNLAKIAANYILVDFWAILKEAGLDSFRLGEARRASTKTEDFLITPENFAELTYLIYTNAISSKIAKIVLQEMFSTGADPSHIIKEKGLSQLTDGTEIEKIVKEVISKNPKPVEDYKKGKKTALQFLVGKVMAATKGKANPEMVNKILKKLLLK